jgi:hypothetical protein
MWINSQIGGKNMTGKLQKRIGFQFFLSIISAAFDVCHEFFRSRKKWFIAIVQQRKEKCEYHKNTSLPALLFV